MATTEQGVVAPTDAAGPKDTAELDRQLGLAKSEESIEKQVRDNVLRSMGQFVNELMRSIRYFESQQKRRFSSGPSGHFPIYRRAVRPGGISF